MKEAHPFRQVMSEVDASPQPVGTQWQARPHSGVVGIAVIGSSMRQEAGGLQMKGSAQLLEKVVLSNVGRNIGFIVRLYANQRKQFLFSPFVSSNAKFSERLKQRIHILEKETCKTHLQSSMEGD